MRSDLTLSQRAEAFFHLTPHFAYPLMVLLSVLLLPTLILSPATDMRTMLIIDLPMCIGTTGSLAAFYGLAERAQGRSALGAVLRLPALIALGVGMAPHLTKAVYDGLQAMAGEFVRTPKKGARAGRYKMGANLPISEVALGLLSGVSVVAAVETGHWFAAPFALMFTFGYGYVASLVVREQTRRALPASESDMATARLAP
jgi:hypothetical protein